MTEAQASTVAGLWLGPVSRPSFVRAAELANIDIERLPVGETGPDPLLGRLFSSTTLAMTALTAGPRRAEEVLGWARHATQLASAPAGSELNDLLENAPGFAAVGENPDDQMRRAIVDIEYIVACQRQSAHLAAMSYQRMSRLSKDYPGLREFYDTGDRPGSRCFGRYRRPSYPRGQPARRQSPRHTRRTKFRTDLARQGHRLPPVDASRINLRRPCGRGRRPSRSTRAHRERDSAAVRRTADSS